MSHKKKMLKPSTQSQTMSIVYIGINPTLIKKLKNSNNNKNIPALNLKFQLNT